MIAISSTSSSSGRGDSGFILVAVLWILAALATLASIYSVYATTTAMVSHVSDDRLQADASIGAGVELAVFQQLAFPDSARPPQGAFSVRVGRTRVAVRYRSEGSRIDLNAAPADLLMGLFAAVGVEASLAKTYADRVVGWRTKDKSNVASEKPHIDSEARVANPSRQAPFDNSLELGLLPGIPKAVVERVLPFVTVFSGRAEVDVRSAEATTLSALPGMTSDVLHNVLQARARDQPDGRELLRLLGPARTLATIDGSKVMRVSLKVAFDNGRELHAEIVFRLNDGDDEPYDLLYWRDDFDSPMQPA